MSDKLKKTIHKTSAFKADFKQYKKDKKVCDKLTEALSYIANGKQLPENFKNHPLKGEFKGVYDCHLFPNIVLLYSFTNESVSLMRIGTHNKIGITEKVTKSRGDRMKLTIKESFSNYDIESTLGSIESKWGHRVMDKMLDWLVDHSDNADDIVNELGYYDVAEMEYWVGNETIEKVM